MPSNKPFNVLYLHSHDAGRYIEPYGFPFKNPNLMQFAKESVLFRKAFCTAPTCGPSRTSLLTGQYPHQVGMYGLPGAQEWKIDNMDKHWVSYFNKLGYETVLSGVQHESQHKDFKPGSNPLGYQRVLELEEPAHKKGGEWCQDSLSRLESFIACRDEEKPFFLSVGIDEPHRDNIPRPELNLSGDSRRFSKTIYYDPDKLDYRYTMNLPWLPDVPEVRKEVESYRVGVELMDYYMGRILETLKQKDLDKNTFVIMTTDHGIEFTGGKKTLSDQGTQVMLLLRAPEGFEDIFKPGTVVEPMVSQLDLYPTLCEMLGQETEHNLEGQSLIPLLKGEKESQHETVFSEQTYHGSMEAMRSARTERYKYILRKDDKMHVMPHDGSTYPVLKEMGWYEREGVKEELYDLYLDPMEACNRANESAYAEIKQDLKGQLEKWMKETKDPFATDELPGPPSGKLW